MHKADQQYLKSIFGDFAEDIDPEDVAKDFDELLIK
jgi:hypothetical protein